MTQGIEKIFNLPSMEDILKEKGVLPEEPIDETPSDEFECDGEPDPELMHTLEMAQNRIDMVEGKDHSDAMDNLHKETLKHAQDLMDFGFNIDVSRARGIFEVAAAMYGRAIEAKNSKREAQLKAMKLALDQRKLDLDEKRIKAQLGETEANTIPGEATIVREDRNEIIKRLREQAQKKTN